jgi:hypothetical protein
MSESTELLMSLSDLRFANNDFRVCQQRTQTPTQLEVGNGETLSEPKQTCYLNIAGILSIRHEAVSRVASLRAASWDTVTVQGCAGPRAASMLLHEDLVELSVASKASCIDRLNDRLLAPASIFMPELR